MIIRRLTFIFAMLFLAGQLAAQPLRVATFNVELKRKGPGVLLRDIIAGKDPQVLAVVGIIREVSPDILLLNSFDYDHGGAALAAFADLVGGYPHRFALRPNRGLRTGLDMDGDGQLGGAADAQGYGYFGGQGGMAILSRYPIDVARVQDFSALKWVDFPDALLPTINGKPFPSKQALEAQLLSSTGHWVVPINLPEGKIHLLAFHATPPVFDGVEDRNGRRNHDEVRFWQAYLDAELAVDPIAAPFVILGDANIDPFDSEGLLAGIQGLLNDARLQDPAPKSQGAVLASQQQAGVNLAHMSDPALDTVDWRDDGGAGNMRVDYVLPSVDLDVVDAGVFWPKEAHLASRHRLVWVDVELGR